jgi:tetratricopeptide (TPR) repeat protein
MDLNMKKTGICLSFFLLSAVLIAYAVVSDEFAMRHKFLMQAVEKNEKSAALLTLNQMKNLDMELYRINNYTFLEAWLKAGMGNTSEAETLYRQMLKENSLLSDYILYELAVINKKTAPQKAINYLETLRKQTRDSALTADSIRLTAEIYSGLGDFSHARRYYDLWSKNGGASKSEARLQSALLLEKEGKIKEAVKIYQEFIVKNKKSDQAVKSLDRLEELDKKGKWSSSSLDFAYHRGMAAFVNWNFDLCARYFYDVYISGAGKNPKKADAMYYLARTYERVGNYPVAVAYYLELLQTYPDSKWEKKTLYQLSRVYFLSGKDDRALKILEFLRKDEKGSSYYSLNSSFLLFQNALSKDDFREALNLSSYISSNFPNKEITRKVQFETAIIYFQQNDFLKALGIIESLLKNRNLSKSLKPELLYWKGRISENLRNVAAAKDIYLDIIVSYPNDFYRFLAQDRLKIFNMGARQDFYKKLLDSAYSIYLKGNEREAVKNLSFVAAVSPYQDLQALAKEKLRFILSQNPKFHKALALNPYPERPILSKSLKIGGFNIHFLKASEFAFLGFYRQAAEEFKLYRKDDYRDIEKLYTLATYYSKAGNPNRALYWAESLTRQLGASIDYQLLPDGVKSLLFPREFETVIDTFAKRRDIDKFFVLALIREESKFKVNAKSPQTARGLMQFIPSTARDLAAELGLEDFELDELYRPEFNINLGTQYLANLMKNFNNNPLYVLSAYNSGETNTKRWRERCSSESPEEFIARIDYPETRNYVKRVMASFRIYKSINAMGQ